MTQQAHPFLNPRQGVSLYTVGAMAALLSAATAFTLNAVAGDAASRYDRERVACTDGSSQQDRATCLKEAGAALGEARGGRLGAGNAATDANATARCDALPAKDRPDCVARIKGAGTTSGSVREGGIYRELVTKEPTPTAPSPSPEATPAVPQQ